MPELPEVETVRRTLTSAIGMRVNRVWTSGAKLRLKQSVNVAKLRKAAKDRYIEDVRRWGKYLLIDFAEGPFSVMVHLGMSGRLRLMKLDTVRPPHTHVVFSLSGKRRQRELRYSDPRRFGQVTWVTRGAEREHPSLAKLGIDPLLSKLGGDHIYRCSRDRRRTMKAFLLDQSIIAGVGNIYASEALWQAQVHPALRAYRLSRRRADRLAVAVHEVFERALEHGGTSLRDFVNADGREGSHAHYLWVYDREGRPCLRCGSLIRRTVMHGRATFHCPKCQRR